MEYLPPLTGNYWLRPALRTLYLPPGAVRFACRRCHALTYVSCQDERQTGNLDRQIHGLAALDALMKFAKTGRVTKALRTARFENGLSVLETLEQERQVQLQKILDEHTNHPRLYTNYLSSTELCERSGLKLDNLTVLEDARLLLADRPSGKYRPKLASWARKLAYLLRVGWAIPEIKAWAKGRWRTETPRCWSPNQREWQYYQPKY